MFLLSPLLIGYIIGIIAYYIAVDILAFRKKKRRMVIKEAIDTDWEAAAARVQAAFDVWDKR